MTIHSELAMSAFTYFTLAFMYPSEPKSLITASEFCFQWHFIAKYLFHVEVNTISNLSAKIVTIVHMSSHSGTTWEQTDREKKDVNS